MSLKKILVQLDSDAHPSVFDSVVAVDAGVDTLLQYGAVEASNVLPLVHGAMFTRGPDQLHQTAVFVGGSNVQSGEAIAQKIGDAFFGPIRVSVMLDGNGSNTTAAAAVLCAARHLELSRERALVLGGTGPVGGRIARLLLRQGCDVFLASRERQRAEVASERILQKLHDTTAAQLVCIGTDDPKSLAKGLEESSLIFGCGAAGVELLSEGQMQAAQQAKVAIDLNAVPPAGLFGIEVTDKAVKRNGRSDYGAIGVGGLKMKIHRAAIQKLFESNDAFLDAEEIFEVGLLVENQRKST